MATANSAKLIAGLIELHQLSQKAFAKRVGVHPSTVTRWRRGDVAPDGRARAALYREFGLAPDLFEVEAEEPAHA